MTTEDEFLQQLIEKGAAAPAGLQTPQKLDSAPPTFHGAGGRKSSRKPATPHRAALEANLSRAAAEAQDSQRYHGQEDELDENEEPAGGEGVRTLKRKRRGGGFRSRQGRGTDTDLEDDGDRDYQPSPSRRRSRGHRDGSSTSDDDLSLDAAYDAHVHAFPGTGRGRDDPDSDEEEVVDDVMTPVVRVRPVAQSSHIPAGLSTVGVTWRSREHRWRVGRKIEGANRAPRPQNFASRAQAALSHDTFLLSGARLSPPLTPQEARCIGLNYDLGVHNDPRVARALEGTREDLAFAAYGKARSCIDRLSQGPGIAATSRGARTPGQVGHGTAVPAGVHGEDPELGGAGPAMMQDEQMDVDVDLLLQATGGGALSTRARGPPPSSAFAGAGTTAPLVGLVSAAAAAAAAEPAAPVRDLERIDPALIAQVRPTPNPPALSTIGVSLQQREAKWRIRRTIEGRQVAPTDAYHRDKISACIAHDRFLLLGARQTPPLSPYDARCLGLNYDLGVHSDPEVMALLVGTPETCAFSKISLHGTQRILRNAGTPGPAGPAPSIAATQAPKSQARGGGARGRRRASAKPPTAVWTTMHPEQAGQSLDPETAARVLAAGLGGTGDENGHGGGGAGSPPVPSQASPAPSPRIAAQGQGPHAHMRGSVLSADATDVLPRAGAPVQAPASKGALVVTNEQMRAHLEGVGSWMRAMFQQSTSAGDGGAGGLSGDEGSSPGPLRSSSSAHLEAALATIGTYSRERAAIVLDAICRAVNAPLSEFHAGKEAWSPMDAAQAAQDTLERELSRLGL